jgi:hypothetical protein
MPRRPKRAEDAIEAADGEALAAASIILRVAAVVRVTRDPYALDHLREISTIARGIQRRAVTRKYEIESEYPL